MAVSTTGVAGHEDHAQIRLQRARALEHGEPVQARHLDVAHHDVELLLRDTAQGLLAVPRDVDLIALGAQQPSHRILDDRFVVNHQYGRAHHYPSNPPRLRSFCISRSKNEGGSDTTPDALHGNGRIGTQFCIGRSYRYEGPDRGPGSDPIASGPDYATDVGRARTFRALVKEGHAASVVEAALRFPLSSDAVSTVLLGYSSLEHLEGAASAVAKGPLPAAALARLQACWAEMAGSR